MRYLFNFSFNLGDETADDEVDALELGFLVNAEGIARLGISSPSDHGPTRNPEGHMDWMGDLSSDFEEEYNAVHDFSGTNDDDVLVEGFCTYEIETEDKARELMEKWRQAFIERIGDASTVSPVVSYRSSECDNYPDVDFFDPSQLADFMQSLADAKAPKASPRP